MDWASKEVVSIVYYLLPGFLTAWVFYGLTAHQKDSPFERVVQALIFTAITQGVTAFLRWCFAGLGHLVPWGAWTENVGLVCSLVVATLLGIIFAGFANSDCVHGWLRDRCLKFWRRKGESGDKSWTWTRRTSHPSEWFSAFRNHGNRYVILHLCDGRRLFGFPEEWPDQPDRGHFLVGEPEWLLKNGRRAPYYHAEALLIPVTQVAMVEFMKFDNEVTTPTEQLAETERLLISVQDKEEEDGQQSSPIPA